MRKIAVFSLAATISVAACSQAVLLPPTGSTGNTLALGARYNRAGGPDFHRRILDLQGVVDTQTIEQALNWIRNLPDDTPPDIRQNLESVLIWADEHPQTVQALIAKSMPLSITDDPTAMTAFLQQSGLGEGCGRSV